MNEDKVKVINCTSGRCIVENADLRISRAWPGRGAYILFTKEQISELMYDPAFSNMVAEGKLYIESDLDFKKEIGAEPIEAEKETIVKIDEKALERLWKVIPLNQFKIEVKALTKSQINDLAKYAIKHGDDGSIQKANFLSEISNYQILKGIELEKLNKEV